MKQFIVILLLCLLFITSALDAQEARAKVALVNLADTMLTHVYGNRWYSSSFKKDVFNYGQKTKDGLSNILGAANINIIEVSKPKWVNQMSLFNLLSKPSKDLEKWFVLLKEDLDADFLVIVIRKFEPENKISHRFLNGKQYGIGTYSKYPDAISIFSFVGYYIFDISQVSEIKINKNHDQYLLTDIRLDRRMSYKKLKDLPEKYIQLTVDKMRNIVNTRNVEIKRTLLEHMNQQDF